MRKPLWKQYQDRCRHFTGLLNKTCEAGIDYADVKTRGPQGLVLPCLCDTNAVICQQRAFLTDDEAKAEEAIAAKAVADFAECLANDICHICHQKVTKVQVGRCVYGEPCGHRLYQGTLPKVKQ